MSSRSNFTLLSLIDGHHGAGCLIAGMRLFLCSSLICLLAFISPVTGEIREIRVFDGSGLFRAQGVIVESTANDSLKVPFGVLSNSDSGSGTGSKLSKAVATVEVLLDRMPEDALQLSPLDSIGEPLTPQMVGERGGKLLFHFYGIQSGAWEINVPSEALLEVRILGKKEEDSKQ